MVQPHSYSIDCKEVCLPQSFVLPIPFLLAAFDLILAQVERTLLRLQLYHGSLGKSVSIAVPSN